MLVLVFCSGTPAFSQYTGFRQGARDSAVPKPIPGFNAVDYPSLAGGLAVETRDLSKFKPGRGLVLWMKDAKKTEMVEYVSCPDNVNGSNYNGKIYASLIDMKTHRVLQTLFFDMSGEEGSSLPFRITSGLYSLHGKTNALGERATVLLDPVAVDANPTCEEYAFYEDPGGCFCPLAVPFGYDSKADKLFRFKMKTYSDEENIVEKNEMEFMVELFFEVIRAPGRNTYDYSSALGHGSEVFTLHRFKYDQKLRTFYGMNLDVQDDDQNNILYFDKSRKLTSQAHQRLDRAWRELKPQP
jgi:hypothetical protein